MKLKIRQIMSYKPCIRWPKEKIIEAIGGESIDVIDFCRLETVNHQDKFWLLLRPEIIPEKELRLLACTWAEDVLPIFEFKYPDDKRPRIAIETVRRYINGEATRKELAAAAAEAAVSRAEAYADTCAYEYADEGSAAPYAAYIVASYATDAAASFASSFGYADAAASAASADAAASAASATSAASNASAKIDMQNKHMNDIIKYFKEK